LLRVPRGTSKDSRKHSSSTGKVTSEKEERDFLTACLCVPGTYTRADRDANMKDVARVIKAKGAV